MGEKLKQLYARAAQRGGITMPVKLAIKTCITTKMAATMEDTPEAIEKVQRAIDELLGVAPPDDAEPVTRRITMPVREDAEPVTRRIMMPVKEDAEPMTRRFTIPVQPAPGGRIKKYFDFAREQGGVTLSARLAVKTCITSQTADTTPDTDENVAKVRSALGQLLPGIALPNY